MENYIDKINKNSVDYELKDSRAARSVEGDTSHVQEANEIYTTTSQSQTDAFSFRTSAGSMSINSGAATISTVYGNTVQTGHTDEVLTATGSFQNEDTTVALDKATWRAQSLENGNYTFVYDGTNWKLEDATVSLVTYGLTVSGTVANGDSISVEYTALVIGTLATATPTSFKATGFNQYNATAGYAHVVGGNQYRVAGTYTTIQFATTPTGTRTTVTVENNKFTPEEDGYIFVTGSGNILVALVWSGTMDSEPWSAYSDNGFNVPTTDANGNNLPTATYGLPSVHGVRDEIDFAGKLYQQRIGHYAYSVENLATVEALGVDYIYDLNDIFYVLPDLVVYELTSAVSGVYEVNDYGTEEWVGTNVPMTTVITYGNSLVDKLRNLADIQSIGTGLTLGANGELSAAGGGGGDKVYSTVQTSNSNYGGSVWIGPLNASQEPIPDPSTSDTHARYVYINPKDTGNYNKPATDTVNILGSVNGSRQIVIGAEAGGGSYGSYASVLVGYSTNTTNNVHHAVVVGSNAQSVRNYGVALGAYSYVDWGTGEYSVALGSYSTASTKGELSIGGSALGTNGYNNTSYRKITNVYDGENAHDCLTVGQANALIDAINSAMNTSIPHIGAGA